MKIINLTAENVKKLKVVDITPTDNMVPITGPCGAGKTSVLDSIWWLLAGKTGIQAVPIRKGAEEARIRGVLGGSAAELVVERKFNASGTTSLTVRSATMLKSGQPAPAGTPDDKLLKLGTPQEVLDALLGGLSFDPLAFARMDRNSQYETLKGIAKIDVDLVALENQNAADFKARTDLNRDAKAKRAQADGITIAADTPEKPIDESDLIGQMEAAAAHNATLEQRKAGRVQAQADANAKKAEGVRLREASARERERTFERVADLKKQIAQAEKDGLALALRYDQEASVALNSAVAIEKKIDEAPALSDAVNVAELRAALDKAKLTNAEIAKRNRRKAMIEEAKVIEAKAEALTKAMAARDEEAQKALQSATMPVDGLSLLGGRVIFNGLPFDQESDSGQLRVSLAIAMAENPKLRVIRIRDGSLLDKKAMQIVSDMAREKDYQVWIERVDESGSVGIVMEDGEVVADKQLQAQEEVANG